MLNIDDILTNVSSKEIDNINNGVSAIDDILIWIDRFNETLKEKEGLSENTLISYNDVLKAFIEYSLIYFKNKKSLLELSENEFNDYLLWMQNYKTNKEYGSVKERIEILLHFLKSSLAVHIYDFVIARSAYLEIVKDSNLKQYNFVLNEFEDYYYSNEISLKKIDNNYIKNYIVSLPKASTNTMMHRRAVLHKFLNFIADSTQDKRLDKIINNLKVYKKQKGEIYESKGLPKETLDKLLIFIDNYTSTPGKYLKRVTKESQYIAYRNTALVLLMLGGGCRASEALSVTYKDIIDTDEKSYKILIRKGKGNKKRTTYILKSLFSKHYNYLLSYNKSDKDRVLSLNTNNKKLNRINLYENVKWMFSCINETKSGLHIFRHHFGSNFAEKNGNIKLLQELLGHSNINTTMIYSSVSEDAKKDAISNL